MTQPSLNLDRNAENEGPDESPISWEAATIRNVVLLGLGLVVAGCGGWVFFLALREQIRQEAGELASEQLVEEKKGLKELASQIEESTRKISKSVAEARGKVDGLLASARQDLLTLQKKSSADIDRRLASELLEHKKKLDTELARLRSQLDGERKHILEQLGASAYVRGSLVAALRSDTAFVKATTGPKGQPGVVGPGAPIGSVVAWPTSVTRLPEGWLVCDGSLLRTDAYPELFKKLGYEYGGGGRNFKVPDYRGYFLRGLDSPEKGNQANRDPETDRGVGSIQKDETRVGQLRVKKTNSLYLSQKAPDDASHLWLATEVLIGKPAPTHLERFPNSFSRDDEAVQALHSGVETRPINVAVNWLIRAK